MEPDVAASFLREVEAELRPLTIALNEAEWEATTTGTSGAQERVAAAETRLRGFLSSHDRHRKIQNLLREGTDLEPGARRQLELLELDHRENLLPRETLEDLVRRAKGIEGEFHSYRARLDGREVTNNDIIRILRQEEAEGRRRAAWEASKSIAPRIADRLLELVDRRNRSARSLGFQDYYAMQLRLQEIEEDALLSLFEELRERTETPFRAAKERLDGRIAQRFGREPEELRPWHYDDPFFQESPLSTELGLAEHFRGRDLPGIARRFFIGIGLPVDDVLERSDLEERPGKDQHAYCMDVDRSGDIRVLANLRDDDRWMGTLLHELGHAAYEVFIPRELPWLLRRPAHTAVTESIAMFLDRLPYDGDWLRRAVEAQPADAEALRARTAEALRFELLLMTRWTLVMTFFERALYADPDRERLDELWWQLVEELQGVRRPPGRRAPDWAAKIHLTVAPVYYHNYLLGELIASQLGATIRAEALDGADPGGYVDRPELGEFLRERVFARGASLHWGTLLREATGSALRADDFVADCMPALERS